MDDFFAPEGAIQQLIIFLLFSYQSRPTPFMPFLILPVLRLYEFLIANGRTSALRHVTRELWRTRHPVAADQPERSRRDRSAHHPEWRSLGSQPGWDER